MDETKHNSGVDCWSEEQEPESKYSNVLNNNDAEEDTSTQIHNLNSMFLVRSSKFRHVYGSAARKENCYEGMRITKDAHDSSFCCANPKFIAVVLESAGGGVFSVQPLEHTGRIMSCTSKVCGHRGPVTDIKWNPFDDNIIASGSDDTTIKVWRIPDGGLFGNLNEWIADLHGHTKKVSYIEWHPTTANILVSAGTDFKCILWNVETEEPVRVISVHSDTIFSISWNRDGSLLATTCKDKKIRVIDPRQGNVLAQGTGHLGPKASKVVFLSKTRLFTTGFSRMSERQYAVWDADNLMKPLRSEDIDASSGVLLPFYDFDTKVLFLAGKGDGNIRYYEIVEDSPYIFYLSQYQSGSPQRGLGVMSKRGLETSKCEIMRFYKLHTLKDICEPISMIVPRKSELFQDDIYPQTAAPIPALTTEEWLQGQNKDPILCSLQANSATSSTVQRKTTKRLAVEMNSTNKRNAPITEQTTDTVTTSQQSIYRRPLTSDKTPASLKNIHRLSSVENQPSMNGNWNRFESRNQVSAADKGDSDAKVTSSTINNSCLSNTDTSIPVDNNELREAFIRQCQELDELRSSVSSKDRRIQTLEEEVIQLRRLVAPSSTMLYQEIPTVS